MQALIPDGPLSFMVHISDPEAMVETCGVNISALESQVMDSDLKDEAELVHTHSATVECHDAGIALGRPVRPSFQSVNSFVIRTARNQRRLCCFLLVVTMGLLFCCCSVVFR